MKLLKKMLKNKLKDFKQNFGNSLSFVIFAATDLFRDTYCIIQLRLLTAVCGLLLKARVVE